MWKTAYVKRGFVGQFDARSAGGINGTTRMRTPLQFGGTKVRVYVRGAFESAVELTRMELVKGADDEGRITGVGHPVLFGDLPGLTLPKGLKEKTSDEMSASITAGTWYVQDRYASETFPYAYEVDYGWSAPGEGFTEDRLSKKLPVRTGIVYRVDVFTTDLRNSIVCYGDSITAGVGSTPNTDRRYPTILGKLLDRPVLNMGQNGDVAALAGGLPGHVGALKGVDTVIFLMGINDIFSGAGVKSAAAYAELAKQIIDGCHSRNLKIYLGTIPGAGGIKQFDSNPAKEILRKEINSWISQGNNADGVIDFAAALADPANTAKLREEYQSDKIHPSDLGYQKMAEVAAQVLRVR